MTLNITLGLMEQIGDLAKRAGNEIMKIYNTDFAVETKADSSPVTEADQIAEDLITRGIQEGLTASYLGFVQWETVSMVNRQVTK